jgi:hypothetical protein
VGWLVFDEPHFTRYVSAAEKLWGYSSVGRALRSQRFFEVLPLIPTVADMSGRMRTLKDPRFLRSPQSCGRLWTGADRISSARGAKRVALVHRAEANSPTMISTTKPSGAQPRTRLAYSRSELAVLLGISSKSLQRLEDRGLIRSSKALRKKLYAHSEVIRFLDHTC